MTPEQAAALRAPFPPETIGKIPKGGALLDYVGHAAVTDRLLAVDPDWTWEPPTKDELERLPNAEGMWIKLTVGGVTRFGWGDGKNVKEWISDAIRNAAMRFGVALDLWSKEDLQHAASSSDGDEASQESTRRGGETLPEPSVRADDSSRSSTPTSPSAHRSPAARGDTGAGTTAPAPEDGPHDGVPTPSSSSAGEASSGESVGQNQLQRIKSKISALRAHEVPVADARIARGLPAAKAGISRQEADDWLALLEQLEHDYKVVAP